MKTHKTLCEFFGNEAGEDSTYVKAKEVQNQASVVSELAQLLWWLVCGKDKLQIRKQVQLRLKCLDAFHAALHPVIKERALLAIKMAL